MQRGTAGVIQDNGRRAYAINRHPKFFDISFVTIPADPTASVMAKVASKFNDVQISSEQAMDNIIKKSGIKRADLIKRIDGDIEAAAPSAGELIVRTQKPFAKKELLDVTAKYSLVELLSTLLSMYIMPKREDFQRMVLYSMGKYRLAEQLDRRGHVFPVDTSVEPIIPADVDPCKMHPELAREYAHWMPERSLTKPLIVIRVLKKVAELEKTAKIGLVDSSQATAMEDKGALPKGPQPLLKNPYFAITGLGALYLGYQKLLNMGDASNLPKMERVIINNPWMLPILAGAAGFGLTGLQKTGGYISRPHTGFKDPGGLNSILAATIPSYFYSGRQEYKYQNGEQIDTLQDFVRKHPFMTSLGALGIIRGGVHALTKRASIEDVVAQMPKEMIEDIYEKIIS